MPLYRYKVKHQVGGGIGEIQAKSEKDAEAKLRRKFEKRFEGPEEERISVPGTDRTYQRAVRKKDGSPKITKGTIKLSEIKLELIG